VKAEQRQYRTKARKIKLFIKGIGQAKKVKRQGWEYNRAVLR